MLYNVFWERNPPRCFPVLEIPVSEGRLGALVTDGLNPVSIIEEENTRFFSKAMSVLVEYNRLYSYEELPTRIKEFVH